MKFNISHTTLLLLLCAIPMACNKTDVQSKPDPQEKSPILLSLGGYNSDSPTKTVNIDGHGYITAFENNTRLHLLMISDDATTPSPKPTYYTETYALAIGSGNAPSEDTKDTESQVSFATGNGIMRYWDDIHARTSQLSIYALATANVIEPKGAPYFQKLCGIGTGWNNSGYETNNFVGNKTNPSVPWSLSPDSRYGNYIGANNSSGKWIIGDFSQNYTVQTMNSVMSKDDLCYSNNIADYSGNGGLDNRLKYGKQVSGKFDHGNLIFHRAMTLFTIKFYPGKGFNPTSANNFQFATGTNVALKGFNKSGYLNIKNGTWAGVETGDWASIDNTDYGNPNISGSGPYWTLLAFVIPGTDISTTAKSDALSFTIDNNSFEVSMKDLYDAIKANPANCEGGVVKTDVLENHTKLKAGNNYEFSFVINKTGIDNITAQIIDWETVVSSQQEPSNARIELQVEDRSGSHTSPVTSNMDIYRALDEASSVTDSYVGYRWTTGYSGKATWNSIDLAYNTEKNRWSTDWYWESNKTYYHFRTLSPTTQVVSTETSKPDYTLIQSATCTTEAGYNQMAWGAPFKAQNSDYKFTYSPTRGFDGTAVDAQSNPIHQIYQAIGPVKEHETHPIKILMFHMFSGVHFTVKTTDTADKVKLYDPSGSKRTKVELIAYYPEGRVRLGTGLVDASGTVSTETSPYIIPFGSATADTEYVSQEYFHSVIPQDLTNVVLVITTPDDNQYKIPMKDLTTSSITSNNIANPYSLNSSSKYVIDRWYPGFKYNYSFKLKKTGIDNIQATIVDWENVDVDEGEVTIQ